MSVTASHHPSIDVLLHYWLDDADPATIETVDEHLMRCDACGQVLDGLLALGAGVRAALRAGAVTAFTSAAFVQRLAGRGLRVREYRLAHNGSVNCTVAPDDELLVARLEAPLHGVERIDARARLSTAPDATQTMRDIPFDPQAGEVLLVSKLTEVRQLPAHTLEITLQAIDAGGARAVGRYTFHHRPWPGH